MSHKRPDLRDWLQRSLQQQSQSGLLRQRLSRQGPQQPLQQLNGQEFVSFCSNDYLGLANHPAVIASLQAGASRYGVGSGASHLVAGHCAAHEALESELAVFLGRERALVFSTGYMANIGVITALMRSGGLVLHDALNHASLLDGGWLSRATSRRFPHADLGALTAMIDQHPNEGPVLVVSDGVFSMDGDVAPLPELVSLCQAQGAWLMIDDAHGIGCLGERGQGVLESQGASQEDVPILVGTLGKALGTSGAFVAGSAALIEYLIQFARPYIYTTAMPPALAEASRVSLQLLQSEPWRRERLQTLIASFRAAVVSAGLPLLESHSPVQAIVFGDIDTTLQASSLLAQQGLHVSAIRPPTVPAGGARLRITLSAAHTDEQLDRLLDALQRIAKQLRTAA